MIILKSCPVCKNDRIARYSQAGLAPQVQHEIIPGVKVPAVIIVHYFQCQNCGVIFQNPRMSDRELNHFYGKGYYRRTLNLTDEEKDRDEMYRAKFDGEIIKKHIGKVKRHLDIGASRGFLLREVEADVKIAVETDTSGVRVKNVEVYPQMNKVPQKSFDLVTAIHVLEHVSDPIGYLNSMVKFVGKDGCLMVEVPTWKSPGGPLRLAHLYHFEPTVLRHLCLQAGLTIIHEEFTPHLLLICQLDNK